jgi:hypothetical protein
MQAFPYANTRSSLMIIELGKIAEVTQDVEPIGGPDHKAYQYDV